ncbi:MAG: sugar transferase [Bacteroidetes bacterium HGW-Bacteroidetes-8]|jgi:lipopolysaccharide/colanic/teichoic acid biosynthesis glycosyltransferase|nr:MAG: sugar transferase [Bacteroidetes bacterium HGW-Bacteroidetes-8]
MYKHFFKPFLDSSLSFFGLVIISPLFLVVWVVLLITNEGGGAFFIQTRPGYRGRFFKVIKFKTMNDKVDCNGNLLPDKDRVTAFGCFIRSLSIDELPQLINVLKGDMSLVGPRPLLVEYLPLYSQEQAKRHNARPGMTGWAQVNGRNAISWKQRLELDVWYVNNVSFWLDVKILFITAKKVFVRDGINASNSVTMEPFRGNN